MTSFTVEVKDDEIHAQLGKASQRVSNMQPVLQAIGEDMVERIKHRFDTSSAPDGSPWAPNADATLHMLSARLGASYRRKNGELNANGSARLASKKPLIESGALRRQIVAMASASDVTVASTMAYAGIQHFGGKAGRGHKVTIPARPFMPVLPDGSLYASEQAAVLDSINEFLSDGI